MSSLFGREKRIIYARRIKGFWEEFRRNKIGLFGIALLLLFVFTALFANLLTPYDPLYSRRLAEGFAMPEWMTVFPQFADLPRTTENSLYWNISQGSELVELLPGKEVVAEYEVGTELTRTYVDLTSNFNYPYSPPYSFNFDFRWTAQNVKDVRYHLQLFLIGPEGNVTRLFPDPLSDLPAEEDRTTLVHTESTDFWLVEGLGYQPGIDNLADMVFSEKGDYSLLLRVSFSPTSREATCKMTIKDAIFIIPGLVHGILGADNVGLDLFSQLVYGARISLMIGLAAAFLSTSVGIVVGVVSGYEGGVVDETLMRIVDILLCLPFLPLLLALVLLFGKNVWYIVILIAIFGWQGLSRIVRSQVLSIRETSFIECARAAGASKSYIMLKHLIPNILPVAFASMVLAVPGAILTEAALSFLGFGDPRAPTWGRMLNAAFGFGAFEKLAWWWILPPGLAITTLCLAFVFMGHAVDEIVNPKLRRRR